MTEQQQKWIEQLSHCSFYPGSFDKRFCRDMAELGPYDTLSEKQAACLEGLAYKYRRQRGDERMAKPAGAVSKQELDKLQAWKDGKPL